MWIKWNSRLESLRNLFKRLAWRICQPRCVLCWAAQWNRSDFVQRDRNLGKNGDFDTSWAVKCLNRYSALIWWVSVHAPRPVYTHAGLSKPATQFSPVAALPVLRLSCRGKSGQILEVLRIVEVLQYAIPLFGIRKRKDIIGVMSFL